MAKTHIFTVYSNLCPSTFINSLTFLWEGENWENVGCSRLMPFFQGEKKLGKCQFWNQK